MKTLKTMTTPQNFQPITQNQKEAIELAFNYFDPLQTGQIPINPTLYHILYSINGNSYPQHIMEEKVKDLLERLNINGDFISLADTFKIASHNSFNKIVTLKEIADSFHILKNVNGEISTQKMKKVLCKVFDKLEENEVENLINRMKTSIRTLSEEEQTTEDNTDGKITIISNQQELFDEMRTRF